MKGHNTCIIPARGGSKGIPLKNIKVMAGKPLLAWTIEVAKKSKYIDRVMVSTDNENIAEIAKEYGAEVHNRSKQNSEDNVHSVYAILECIEYYKSLENIIMLLATSPLRTNDDIDEAIELFEDCNSVVSVVKFDKPITSLRKLNKEGYMNSVVDSNFFEMQRQDIREQIYEVNGSIFISDCGNLKKNKSFHNGKVKPYIMPKCRSIDINSMDDWILAETILEKRNI